MNIAVLGGRFDPPHNGHLAIAQEVLRIYTSIYEVWLVPANTHPWKQMIASPSDRLNMTKFLENKSIKISDMDIKRGGETFTIDSVNQLQKDFSNQYFWVIGSDQLADFPKWKDAETLQHLIKFLVVPRSGAEKTNLPENFIWIDGADIPDISSSQVRNSIKNNQPITGLVPEGVEKYIVEKELYR